jgi:peptidoglycan/xylan/chitin deacetylase (PgdA/CDA1 family)
MGSAPAGKIVLACLLVSIVLFSTVHINAQGAESGQTKKYVVFREDDVTPGAKFAELQAVNQVQIDKNVPVTMGIIPHPNASAGNQLLENKQFLNYMRSIDSNRLFEFAQHGYTHQSVSGASPSEFYGRPYTVQYDAIKKGRDDIKQAFGIVPTTFIPPFDKGDNNTLKAVKALGFTEYSTSFRDFNINEGYMNGVRTDAVSLVFANESLQSMESATDQFLNDTHGIDTLVVLYHPADFSGPDGSINSEKIKMLSDYIDYLEGTGRVQFTKLDRTWTTEGSGGSSSSGASTLKTTVASNSEANSIWTGSGLSGGLPLYASFGLIAFACIGLLWFKARLNPARRPPKRL